MHPPKASQVPAMIFAISLVGKQQAKSWTQTCENLKNTLQSIARSSDNRYEIWIACNDIEDVDLANLASTYSANLLRAEQLVTQQKRRIAVLDKEKKRRLIGAALRAQGKAGYIMFLDADDLIHKNLVAHVLNSDNRRSYIATTGVTIDMLRNKIEETSNFDIRCGSCFVGYYEVNELPQNCGDITCYFSCFTRHSDFSCTAEAYGKPADEFPFPAVAYVTQHGSSLTFNKYAQSRHYKSKIFAYKLSTLAINLLNPRRHRDQLKKVQRMLLNDFGITFKPSLLWRIASTNHRNP